MRKDGGPAFPIADPFAVDCPKTTKEALRLQQGMSLRDYIAVKAMEGDWAAGNGGLTGDDEAARRYYRMADAMLAERDK